MRLANVDMGMPVLLSQGVNRELTPEVRKEIADSEIWEVLDVQDKEMSMIHISMGNPHAVFFVDDVDNIEIEKIGPAIETHPRFPDRTNVEFVQIVDESHVKMRVWERGAGETMACGTGACAVAPRPGLPRSPKHLIPNVPWIVVGKLHDAVWLMIL